MFQAAEDYPRDLLELEACFSTEAACREYLFALRWPDGFRCPRYGEAKSWPKPDGLVRCAGCDDQVSVTGGTVFQDSSLPLSLWFRAAWWVTSQKNRVSAMGLQRVRWSGRRDLNPRPSAPKTGQIICGCLLKSEENNCF